MNVSILHFTAGPGEQNDVTVTPGPAWGEAVSVEVKDTGSALGVGPGCTGGGNPGAVAITPTSLVTMTVKVSAMGAIKEVTEVLSIVPLSDVDALEVKRVGMTGVMESTSGGSSFKLEGKPGDMKELAEVFERAKAAA